MGRKKVKLQWIMNDTARRTTYKKRVKNLMKKVMELSILCGVQACAIVYSPYDPQPEVWPSPVETVRVIEEFNSRPENDQTHKRLNHENYTRQRVAKAKEQVVKRQRKNWRMEIENLMYQCLAGGRGLQGLNIRELTDLAWSIDDRLKEIHHKMEFFHHLAPQPGGATAPVAVPVAQETHLEVAVPVVAQETHMEVPVPVAAQETHLEVAVPVAQATHLEVAVPVAQATHLQVTLESLENELLSDVAPMPRESVVSVAYPGGQDMTLPGLYDHYEDPSFWGHPFFR